MTRKIRRYANGWGRTQWLESGCVVWWLQRQPGAYVFGFPDRGEWCVCRASARTHATGQFEQVVAGPFKTHRAARVAFLLNAASAVLA